MTPELQPETFSNIPGFQKCSPEILQRICSEGKLEQFQIGHALSTKAIISNRVLLILQGKVRLLGKNKGKLCALACLGPGNVVGLSSLLRAEGCEEVSAATFVKAWSIPDTLIAEIYSIEKGFREWCASNVFISEGVELLETILEQSPQSAYGIVDILEKVLPRITSIRPINDDLRKAGENLSVYIASANSDATVNSAIDINEDLPSNKGPFDLRILGIPHDLVKQINQGPGEKNKVETNTDLIIDTNNDNFPQKTSLELEGNDPRDQVDLISGKGNLEESIACLKMICQILDIPFRRDSAEKIIRGVIGRGIKPNSQMFGQILSGMGLLATGGKLKSSFCTRMNVPCLIEWGHGWGVVVRSNSDGLLLAHPRLGWLDLDPQDIEEQTPDGFNAIFVDRTNASPDIKFNLNWFLPALKRYQSTLILVLASSFIVQLFTLANPLLIQIIIDKVISQRSLDTLQVLGIALVAVTIFEGIISSLRTFLFTDTTNRIDMRLGAEVIDHLLRLPIGYFDKRPVGELGTRVAELEKIRNFLTGEALTTLIDAAFSIIYIIVMSLYSWALTIVALIVVPVQIAITLGGAPLFRRQFRKTAEANARTQSHLVEVLTGIQTVKAQNVEMVSRWKWQERYSAYISRSFEKTITATALGQTGQVLQKISQLMVLWVGASLVLNGELTLGQLIAFRIISGYVTQPLMRLSTIWQRIQELRVSFERLADIVDMPEESTTIDKAKIALPPVAGAISFENVDFRFSEDKPKVLKNIDLEIPAGTFVGIVGQSGSGKSTLMKLLPRLYSPSEGKIRVDNYDIDKVELYSLRRQIGIVPQEPLLFSGNVSDNIALTDPNATSEEIKKAAETACAHEFIMNLSSGYSTELGERGANLSGGQRQRLAIARTLLSKPKLLVMDEATSALDYDTERRVCQNLRDSLRGCTVFFVTHRLSTIRNADLIVMMHQGSVVETGNHEDLMKAQGRYYALYRQQEAG